MRGADRGRARPAARGEGRVGEEKDPDAFLAPAPWERPARARVTSGGAARPCPAADRRTYVKRFWNQKEMFEWVDDQDRKFPADSPESSPACQQWSLQWRYFSREIKPAEATEGAVQEAPGCETKPRPVRTQGSREYLCASFEGYWKLYLRDSLLPGGADAAETTDRSGSEARPPPNQRESPLHDYELIREGHPCRLYYDLEYSKGANIDVDGPQMVQKVVSLTREVLLERFGLILEDEQVLELDSSSPKKFSRHLIFHLQRSAEGEVAFRSNQDAGVVARAVVEKSADQVLEHGCAAGIFVSKDVGGKRTFPFIDLGVYSRNRVFRMYGFSKLGKDELLLPTRRFMGAQLPGRPGELFCEDTFRASLVTFVSGQYSGREFLECEEARPAGPPKLHLSLAGAGVRGEVPSSRLKRKGPDPPQKVLAFMGQKASELGRASGGAEGWVRSCVSLSARAVVFNISGTRFCPRIGREHKSNGVYFMADLEQGVWWQKCYDPDCRNFSTAAQAFPRDVLELPLHTQGDGMRAKPQGLRESGPPVNCGDDLLVAALEEYEENAALEKVMASIEERVGKEATRGVG